MQSLRNCSGQGSPARIPLNGHFYKRCPRAISLESLEARYLVNLYFECEKTKTYPAPGSWADQTAFTVEVFDYIEQIIHEARERVRKENEKPSK